jgi:hypothetical protein
VLAVLKRSVVAFDRFQVLSAPRDGPCGFP